MSAFKNTVEDFITRHHQTINDPIYREAIQLLRRSCEVMELHRLEKKVASALAKKFLVNTYGTHKQCRKAFRELWTACDELEAYENDKR